MRNRTFKLIFAVMIFGVWLNAAAYDELISRDGKVMKGTVKAITDDTVYVVPKSGDKVMDLMTKAVGAYLDMDIKDLYLVRKEKEMSVFIHTDGSRDSVASPKLQKDAMRIYLTEGREIQGWDVETGDSIVSYLSSKPNKKKPQQRDTIPASYIFLLLYSDGNTKVINELPEEKEEIDYAALEEERDKKVKERIYKLPRTMTIAEIAKKHKVTVKEILTWNGCPAKYTGKTRLKAGCTVWIAPPLQGNLVIADD